MERFWNKVKKTQKCWKWLGAKGKGGYGKIMFSRFSWELHYGPIPEGFVICHHCDNRICVNPHHLFLGTLGDNLEDMTKKGRRATGLKVAHPGSKNPSAALTEQQVLEIRKRSTGARGEQTRLAEEYGITQVMIGRIINRKSWTHI